ncbi:unnamed protein product [Arctogadus glacialis]
MLRASHPKHRLYAYLHPAAARGPGLGTLTNKQRQGELPVLPAAGARQQQPRRVPKLIRLRANYCGCLLD